MTTNEGVIVIQVIELRAAFAACGVLFSTEKSRQFLTALNFKYKFGTSEKISVFGKAADLKPCEFDA